MKERFFTRDELVELEPKGWWRRLRRRPPNWIRFEIKARLRKAGFNLSRTIFSEEDPITQTIRFWQHD